MHERLGGLGSQGVLKVMFNFTFGSLRSYLHGQWKKEKEFVVWTNWTLNCFSTTSIHYKDIPIADAYLATRSASNF